MMFLSSGPHDERNWVSLRCWNQKDSLTSTDLSSMGIFHSHQKRFYFVKCDLLKIAEVESALCCSVNLL